MLDQAECRLLWHGRVSMRAHVRATKGSLAHGPNVCLNRYGRPAGLSLKGPTCRWRSTREFAAGRLSEQALN